MKKLNQNLTPRWHNSKKPPPCSVVIAAAGNSIRCKGEDKLLYNIHGKPVLIHTIEKFEKCDLVREIVIVVRPEQVISISGLCKEYELKKVSKVVAGGDTRTLSVNNGVFAVSGKAKYIAIHDGARPCVDNETIISTLERAVEYHAAAPGVPVISTIKRADMNAVSYKEGKPRTLVITETVDRDALFEIQTPQIFKTEIIKAALTNAINKGIPLTDECMAVELINMPVHIVEGCRSNIKITEPDDFKIAEALLYDNE